MPNGAHGDRSETVTRSRGRPRKVAVSEAQHIPASARDIHVAAERDNLEAEACELVRPYHRGEWEISPRSFTFDELSGLAPSPPRRLEERLSEALAGVERQLVEKCMGEAPVFFRDQHGRAAAIVATLKDWKTEDCSAALIGIKYRLTCAPAQAPSGASGEDPDGRLPSLVRA